MPPLFEHVGIYPSSRSPDKAELLEGGAFEDVEQARSETFSYNEGYYDQAQRHSALGYKTPEEFEQEWESKTKGESSERVMSGKTCPSHIMCGGAFCRRAAGHIIPHFR